MILENKIELFNKDLGIILSQLAYHIHVDIINYIQDRNISDYQYFSNLFKDKIDVNEYLFNGSACVFPGVKRYIRGQGNKFKYNEKYKAILDDNAFPRHIWCFLINGKTYNGPNWKITGLEQYEIAHIFSHKDSELEIEQKYFSSMRNGMRPYGDFTCAANTVLLPKGTVRPTDNSTLLKSIFYKRYIELYGESTLGGRQGFKMELTPSWYSDLKWNDPVLPDNWKYKVDRLLEYRKNRITEIMKFA